MTINDNSLVVRAVPCETSLDQQQRNPTCPAAHLQRVEPASVQEDGEADEVAVLGYNL